MTANHQASEHYNNVASCLCGKIRFTVTQFLPAVAHCHCVMCRKFHGAAFSTFAEVKKQDLHWLSGQEHLAAYRAGNDTVRKFCQCCGSSLLFESNYNRQDNTIEVALAVFDRLGFIEVKAHIFVKSKVHWLTVNDKLPKYLAFRE